MSYEFRPVETSPEAINEYVSLFHLCYPRAEKYTHEYVLWQYEKNPCGRIIGFDAVHNGHRVAHYVVLPQRYKLANGEEVLGAVSLNTVTHPEHQGKGLFSKLAERTYEASAEKGLALITGVANHLSFPGFVKRLGFSSLGRVPLSVGAPSKLPLLSDRTAGIIYSAASLSWRLSNPSRTYGFRTCGEDSACIYSAGDKTEFCLGRISKAQVPPGIECRRRRYLPSLIPSYGCNIPWSLEIPKSWLPSPWEFIGLDLGGHRSANPFEELTLYGIDMDSF